MSTGQPVSYLRGPTSLEQYIYAENPRIRGERKTLVALPFKSRAPTLLMWLNTWGFRTQAQSKTRQGKARHKARQGQARQGKTQGKAGPGEPRQDTRQDTRPGMHLDGGGARRAVDSLGPEAGFLEHLLHHRHSPLDVGAGHLPAAEHTNERNAYRTRSDVLVQESKQKTAKRETSDC